MDPCAWPLTRLLSYAEALLDQGAGDEQERARRRADLYRPPALAGGRRRTRRTAAARPDPSPVGVGRRAGRAPAVAAPPVGGGMTRDQVADLLSAVAAEDARFTARP